MKFIPPLLSTDLRLYPRDEATLRLKSQNVLPEQWHELPALIAAMKQEVKELGGVGLSAIQLGVPVRVILVKDVFWAGLRHRDQHGWIVMVNPTIVVRSLEEEEGPEGCLSLPGVQVAVRRRRVIKVEWLAFDDGRLGDLTSEVMAGLPALIVQHEIDHLDGVIMLDHVGPFARQRARAKLRTG